MKIVLLIFNGFDHSIQRCDKIEFFLTAVAVIAISFIDLQLQLIQLLPETVNIIDVMKFISHLVKSSLGVGGLPNYKKNISIFNNIVVSVEECLKNTQKDFINVVILFIEHIEKIAEQNYLFLFFY